MRLHDLFEEDDDEKIEAEIERENFFKRIRHYALDPGRLSISTLRPDGSGKYTWMSIEQLPLKLEHETDSFPLDKFSRVSKLAITGPLKSLKGIPPKVDSLSINVNEFLDDPQTDSQIDDANFYACSNLSTFRNLKMLSGMMYANRCPKITSWKAFPAHSRVLYVYELGITSFKNIHKDLPDIQSIEYNGDVKDGFLDLLRAKNFRDINYSGPDTDPQKEVCEIINKHAKNGLKGVVAAQRELLEKDLEDYE